MATYTGTSGNYKTTLTVTETATSIPNNTSTLSWSLKVERIGGASYQYGIYNGNQCPWSVSINGSRVGSGTFSYDFRYTGSYNLGSGNNVTVTHSSDGTKTVSVSASVDMDNSDYVGVMRPSGSLTLTTIPRASSVTVNATHTISSSSGNLSYSVTSKANFYHKAIWSLGGTTTEVTLGQINATTTSFNITNTALLNALPDLQSSTLSITVNTFSDGNYSNLIGSSTASCVVTITLKPSAPTLTTAGFGSRSTGVNASITSLTAGFTTAAVTVWSHGSSQGATGYTTYFSAYYGSSNTAVGLKTTSATAANTVIETQTLPASAKQYTLTISAYTTDSRGLSSTATTTQLTVYGYSIPTLNLTAYRVTGDVANKSPTRDDAGVTVRIAYSNVLRGQTDANGNLRTGNQNQIVTGNSNTFCKYGNTIASESPLWVALSASSSLTVTYQVKDYFTTTSTSISVPTASFPLDLYDDGNGTVGIGLGTVAVANQVKTPLPINGAYYFSNVYTTTINANELTTSGFYGIRFAPTTALNYPVTNWGVLFVGGTNITGTLFQIYIPDSTNVQLYKRGYTNNAWTSWTKLSAGTADSATRATNATYADWTETNPSALTNYYLPFGAGYTTNTSNRGLSSNNGLMYRTRQGTTSAMGYSILGLGNATATGTAGNKAGVLRLYASDTTFTDIYAQAGGNGYTAWLPKLPATAYLNSSLSVWTGTKKSSENDAGTSIPNLALYNRARIYAIYKGTSSMVWEADVAKIVSMNRECEINHTELSFMSWTGGSGYYQTFFKVSLTPSGNNMTLKFTEVRNFSVPFTGSTGTSQTGNDDYYIYRVDGVM